MDDTILSKKLVDSASNVRVSLFEKKEHTGRVAAVIKPRVEVVTKAAPAILENTDEH